MIVAFCLMAAVFLTEVRSAKQVTEARSAKQDKASNPDVDLTTVRLFCFIPHDKLYEQRKILWRQSSANS
jgi:hypothetical protein